MSSDQDTPIKGADEKQIMKEKLTIDCGEQAALRTYLACLDDNVEALSSFEVNRILRRVDEHFGESTEPPSLDELVLRAQQISEIDQSEEESTDIKLVYSVDDESTEDYEMHGDIPETAHSLIGSLRNDEFDLLDAADDAPVIKLIGVGGGGSNAVEHMVNSKPVIMGVEFICANTDSQALMSMNAQTIVQIGRGITRGLGAGANPEIGRRAALEDKDLIKDLIEGTDMLFVTAGMGGGTGTGAIPVIAEIAREMGVLTVAVVTKPFPFEGAKRMAIANQGIEELRIHVDSLITIPNEKLLSVLGKNISLLDAFCAANDVLRGAIQGISELITNPGLINVDFADVRTVMSEKGLAMMGSGNGRGDQRAATAVEMAVSSPLLEDVDLAGARGILVNVTAGMDMAIGEFEEIGNVVKQFAGNGATVVIGTAIDDELEGELRVTVVATGLATSPQQRIDNMRPIFNVPIDQGHYHSVAASGAASGAGLAPAAQPEHVKDLEDLGYLDIPAFLRRQAD